MNKKRMLDQTRTRSQEHIKRNEKLNYSPNIKRNALQKNGHKRGEMRHRNRAKHEFQEATKSKRNADALLNRDNITPMATRD
jgi:hypothetical protein